MERHAGTHLQEAYDEVAEQAREVAERAPVRLREGLRDGAFVLIGAADVLGEQLRETVLAVIGAPARVSRATWELPSAARRAARSLRDRGEALVRGVRERESVMEAEDRFATALRGAKGAATSARRAVASGTEAVRDLAGDPSAGRAAPRPAQTASHPPYEERTYDELYDLAATRGIEGRSKMTKDELIAALRT